MGQTCSRRAFLKQSVCGALLAGEKPGFRHRSYLGWITDLDSRPDTNAAWPSMRLDAPLLSDYREKFRLMQRLGFNEAAIWDSTSPGPGRWTSPRASRASGARWSGN